LWRCTKSNTKGILQCKPVFAKKRENQTGILTPKREGRSKDVIEEIQGLLKPGRRDPEFPGKDIFLNSFKKGLYVPLAQGKRGSDEESF